MFKRLRGLKLSLAAKCQILFGTAVVLIIAAALWVPWQRIEQLLEQLNERTAAALADRAVAEHIAFYQSRAQAIPTTRPATLPTTLPGPRPGIALVLPRLIPIDADPLRTDLTSFERRALGLFTQESPRDLYSRGYETPEGDEGYRYARLLYNTENCMSCHTDAGIMPAGFADDPDRALASTQPAVARPLGFVSVDIPSQVEPRQSLLNRVFILTAGLLAGTLAILVFFFITTRLILQPVRVLKETAEKVSEGDLNIRSDISTGDEFEQLSRAFNIMLTNLQSSEDQLRAVNKSLDLKLGQLAESNVALYESNRLKSEFLANVSHELRTPLNSILGFADLLKDAMGQSSDGKVIRYIQNILNSGRNLLDLINDLLDLAKIEAGRMEVRSEPLSLSDVFEGLGSLLKPLLEQKKLDLQIAVEGDVPIIHTDPAKLQQVLYNFLSNAIKFSPPGGPVRMSARLQGDDRVRVAVSDTGPGIRPEDQQVIFEKFRQVDGSVTRQHSGTGLGLAISKELVTLLGGDIGVDSNPGEGATFWITLPLKIVSSSQDVRAGMILD